MVTGDFFSKNIGRRIGSALVLLMFLALGYNNAKAQYCEASTLILQPEFAGQYDQYVLNYFEFDGTTIDAFNFDEGHYYDKSGTTINTLAGAGYPVVFGAGAYEIVDNNINYYGQTDVKVYLDINKDQKFEESEIIYNSQDKGFWHEFDLPIPAGQAINNDFGDYRMRVAMDAANVSIGGEPNDYLRGCKTDWQDFNLSFSTVFGQTRDYTINIKTGNDAAATQIMEPTPKFTPGEQNIVVRVKNNTDNPIDQVDVLWTVDGSEDPTTWTRYTWSDSEDPIPGGSTKDIKVGTYDFQYKQPMDTYTIKAKAANPNGVVDENQNNDRAPDLVVAPSLQPGMFSIGTGQDFPMFTDAVDYMRAWGIVGAGDLEFEVYSGTYNEQFSLSNFDHDGNHLKFYSRTGNASAVTVQYAIGDPDDNYIVQVCNTGLSASFENMTFKTLRGEGQTYGRIFDIGCHPEDINLMGNVLEGHENPARDWEIIDATEYALFFVDTDQPGIVNLEQNTFRYGTYSVYAMMNGSWNTTFNTMDNDFYGFANWAYWTHHNAASKYFTSSITKNNLNGDLIGDGGIHTNGSTVTDNVITGLMGSGNDRKEAAISVIHPSASTEDAIITNNRITNCEDVNGIWVEAMNGMVNDNEVEIQIYEYIARAGIVFENSGNEGGEMEAHRNNIMMTDGNGLEIVNSTVQSFFNYIYTEGVYFGNRAAVLLEGADGYLAANMIMGNNAVGVLLDGARGIECYYNSMNVFFEISDKNKEKNDGTLGNGGFAHYTVYFYESNRYLEENNKEDGDAPLQGQASNATFKRNIIYNSEDGMPIGGPNIGILNSDYNNLYSEGMNFDLGAWQGQGYDANSVSIPVQYASNTDLHLTQYDQRLYVDFPLGLENEELENQFQEYDWDDEFRTFFYFGVDNLYPQVEIIDSPERVVDCIGAADHMFIAVANATLGSRPLYQWQKDGENIPGETESALLLDALTHDMSGTYRCKIVAEGGDDVKFTEETLLYVLTEPDITRNPETVAADLGETVMFEVQAHIRGDVPPEFQPEIEWRKAGTPLNDNDRIAGADASIMSIRNLQSSDYGTDYKVTLYGHCGTVTSEEFGIISKPSITVTEHPQPANVCKGEDVAFTSDAQTNGTDLTFHWYKDGNGLMNDARISGVNSRTLTITDVEMADAGGYSCQFTAQPGDVTEMSNSATFAVDPMPMITTQPQAVTTEEGSSFTLNIEASYADSYQWYKDGSEIAGAASSSYSSSSVTMADAGNYHCMVSNVCGEVSSDTVTVEVSQDIIANLSSLTGDGYSLGTAQPNPVSGESHFSFTVPQSMNVRITLMDASGRETAVLFDETASAGINRVELDASEMDLSSGVYYYVMKASAFTQTKRLVIVK